MSMKKGSKNRPQLSGEDSLFEWVKTCLKTDVITEYVDHIRGCAGIPKVGLPSEASQPQIDPIIDSAIDNLAEIMSLHPVEWDDVLWHYICYGELLRPNEEFGVAGLAYITTIEEERDEPFGDAIRKMNDHHFPIILRISPHITERQLIHYIKKQWGKNIDRLKSIYLKDRRKIVKVRRKSVRISLRNSRIFELYKQGKKYKEISAIIVNEFPDCHRTADQGAIGKIIQLQKKLRTMK